MDLDSEIWLKVRNGIIWILIYPVNSESAKTLGFPQYGKRQIYILTLTGLQIPLNIDSDTTIDDVKGMIQSDLNLLLNMQNVIAQSTVRCN